MLPFSSVVHRACSRVVGVWAFACRHLQRPYQKAQDCAGRQPGLDFCRL